MNLVNYLARIWLDSYDKDKVEGVYFYAHQENFVGELFSIIPNLPSDITIYILDSPVGLSGCLGFRETKNLITSRYSVLESRVKPIPFLFLQEGMVNTLNESKSLVDYLKSNSLTNILIASPPFHLPRAFLSLLSSSLEIGYSINIICAPSNRISDWDVETYTHSQGSLRGTVSQLLQGELERIDLYHQKGDLLSIEKALDYLSNIRIS